MSGSVCVVGSFMMDVVVRTAKRPAVGETVIGESVSFFLGGKGFNQALASARYGTPTSMVGRVGTDSFGDSLYVPEVDFDVVDRVGEVAAERGVPSAQVALAWLLSKPAVTAPIVGVTVHQPGKKGFIDKLRRAAEVLECHHVAGADSYLLTVVARSLETWSAFSRPSTAMARRAPRSCFPRPSRGEDWWRRAPPAEAAPVPVPDQRSTPAK